MNLLDIFESLYSESKGSSKYVFIRFGLPNVDEMGKYTRSYCYNRGVKEYAEDGVSVFEAEYMGQGRYKVFALGWRLLTSFQDLMRTDKDIYLVSGEYMGTTGSDGEILLDPCTFRVIKKLDKKRITVLG